VANKEFGGNEMTEPKKKRKAEEEIPIDLGLGGVFKGLGNFIDLLSDMVEKTENVEETTRSGEFKIKGLGEKGRGVYGFSVRTGIGGMPRVEHFGNIRTTQEGPEVADVREPMVDVFDEEQEILIVVELPGVSEEEIRIEIQDDVLSLETTGDRKYAKEVLLPAVVNAAAIQKAYKNGILEIHLKK
jgi:HSP20 family protein